MVPDLAEVGPDAFEYNPYLPARSPDEMMVLFRRSGYDVTDAGGGVLRLTGAGMNRPVFLLPGRPSVPALARLARPGERLVPNGLRVVQTQNAAVEALSKIAVSSPDNARAVLEGMGRHFDHRHLDATAVQAIQGIVHFLHIGGSPRTLVIVLGLGKDYGTNEVRVALGRFAEAARGGPRGDRGDRPPARRRPRCAASLGHQRSTMDRIVGIASHFDEPGSVSAVSACSRSARRAGSINSCALSRAPTVPAGCRQTM